MTRAVAFPAVRWQEERATFVAAEASPDEGDAPAALVFPFYGDRLALADIPGRGWCIPSGRREPGESAEETARREAFEEVGVRLGRMVFLGRFVLTDERTGAIRQVPAFVGEVTGLLDLPSGTESRGRLLTPAEEIAELYYTWDALLAAVFAEAVRVREERLCPGTPLPVG